MTRKLFESFYALAAFLAIASAIMAGLQGCATPNPFEVAETPDEYAYAALGAYDAAEAAAVAAANAAADNAQAAANEGETGEADAYKAIVIAISDAQRVAAPLAAALKQALVEYRAGAVSGESLRAATDALRAATDDLNAAKESE